ncbi:hypothetical protein [Dolichospermum phage Dfl-JY45]
MSAFESELRNDPIIRAAMERERSGRGATHLALGIVVGNLLFAVFMGWLPPLMLADPGVPIPYGSMAVNGLAVAILLFGWARITKAQTAISERCKELLKAYRQDRG